MASFMDYVWRSRQSTTYLRPPFTCVCFTSIMSNCTAARPLAVEPLGYIFGLSKIMCNCIHLDLEVTGG